MGLPLMRELGAKWLYSGDGSVHQHNPQFVVRGFTWSRISLVLDGIYIENYCDEDTSDDDFEEDEDDEKNDDDGEDDDDDKEDDSDEEDNEGNEEEEVSSEYERNDEESYIEDDAELSDVYKYHGNDVPVVVEDED